MNGVRNLAVSAIFSSAYDFGAFCRLLCLPLPFAAARAAAPALPFCWRFLAPPLNFAAVRAAAARRATLLPASCSLFRLLAPLNTATTSAFALPRTGAKRHLYRLFVSLRELAAGADDAMRHFASRQTGDFWRAGELRDNGAQAVTP